MASARMVEFPHDDNARDLPLVALYNVQYIRSTRHG
jgi:hypothetical protein